VFGKLRPGLTLSAATEFTLNERAEKDAKDPRASDKIEGSAKYVNDKFNGMVKYGRDRSGLNTGTVCGALGYQGFNVGGDCNLEFRTLANREATACSTGAQFKQGGMVISAFLRDKIDKEESSRKRTAEVSFRHDVESVSFAASLVHAFPRTGRNAEDKEIQLSSSDSYAVGVMQTLAGGAKIQGKLDSKAILSVAYTEAIRPNLKFTVSSEIDTRRVSAGKVGFSLNYE